MPRILVVEDEPLIAMLVADWLSELDCEPVGPVATVAAALTLVGETELDGAVLDVSLDGQDSYAVADALRARQVPFAFATGHGVGHIVERFRDVPILIKPYDFERVRAVVTHLLDRKVVPSGPPG